MEVKKDDGTLSKWELELPGAVAMANEGLLRFVKQGDEVRVSLWQEKNGSLRAHVLTMTLPDGRTLKFPEQGGMPFPK
jgi:hypothetical protein